MAEHVAAVKDGKLDYSYTDSSKKQTQATGSNLGYDQFLTLLCAEMQYQDPLEPTSNTEYVAQLATFSQLEATLSMQQSQENSMANDLIGKHVILKVEDENTGATNYVDGKVDYVLYDGLYSIDTLDTVADSDYYEAVTISKTFSNMVAQLPDIENITTDYDKAISQIREMYDGMTSYQQKFVKADDLQTLQKYEERIAELKKAEENTKTDTDTDADTDNKTDADTKTDTDTETKTEE